MKIFYKNFIKTRRRHFDLISNEKEKSRKFKSTKAGIIDLEMYLNNADEVKIEVFENNSKNLIGKRKKM